MDVKRHASLLAEMAAQLITAEPDSAVAPKDVLDAAHLKADLEVLASLARPGRVGHEHVRLALQRRDRKVCSP